MKIGEQIKYFRKEKNLSQENLAEQFNVTRQTISNWENEKSLPDLEMIIEISRFFDCSIDQLLTGEEKCIQLDTPDEKKEYSRLKSILMFTVFSLLIAGGLFYYLSRRNLVSFRMNQEKTVNTKGMGVEELGVGYFSVPKKTKVILDILGEIDSKEEMEIRIVDQDKHAVYQISHHFIKDHQQLLLESGSYEVQITTNDHSEKNIVLSYYYDIRVKSK